jgi:hypothetical protein
MKALENPAGYGMLDEFPNPAHIHRHNYKTLPFQRRLILLRPSHSNTNIKINFESYKIQSLEFMFCPKESHLRKMNSRETITKHKLYDNQNK